MRISLAIRFGRDREFSHSIELFCQKGYFLIGSSSSADLLLEDPDSPKRTMMFYIGPQMELRLRDEGKAEQTPEMALAQRERIFKVGQSLRFGTSILKVIGFSGVPVRPKG